MGICTAIRMTGQLEKYKVERKTVERGKVVLGRHYIHKKSIYSFQRL